VAAPVGGAYWQRGSFDAIVVIASVLSLIVVAPKLRHFTWREWVTTIAVCLAVGWFSILWAQRVHLVERLSGLFQRVETTSPR